LILKLVATRLAERKTKITLLKKIALCQLAKRLKDNGCALSLLKGTAGERSTGSQRLVIKIGYGD
jgi:hypothetical protein